MIAPEVDQIIHVMPETLANKIAAGEVVQRPASAAKELIENAIDAGADTITLVLKRAGSELIQVIDNGCGMSRADAEVAFRRHATSKVREAEDLEQIYTLGFRGEALASIAAVAQVEMKTKRAQDGAGVRIQMDGGVLVQIEPCATPRGTSIAIRNLFYNVPARRNFLKTPATEFKHLVETFQFLALSHPRIGFTLLHDDNEVYRLQARPDVTWEEAMPLRIVELLGDNYEDMFVPVEETTSYLSVRGFVGLPQFTRRSRNDQYLFVNDRYVKSRYLNHAVSQGYGTLLADGQFPFFTLFLSLDPRHVDVNVHPTKAEVKFDDERGIYAFIQSVVRKVVGQRMLTPQMPTEATTSTMLSSEGISVKARAATPLTVKQVGLPAGSLKLGGATARPASSRPTARPNRPASSSGSPSDWAQLYQEPQPAPEEPLTERSSSIPSDATRPNIAVQPSTEGALLWQLHDRYILTQIHSGLMVVDQNAAHERILYERALESMANGFGMTQQLLFPQTFDFGPADYELLRELWGDLQALGFEIEEFGGRSVVVRGVPVEIRPGDERTVLEDLLEQYKAYHQSQGTLKVRENLARSLARKSAIPAGKRLQEKEMRSLVDQLFQCSAPATCPNGRLTLFELSRDELDKRFGR
ncbi:MAG: DNA mismatch repair endonuclease MutL [Rhodothermales bacterium]